MGGEPREGGTIQPVSWRRMIWPLVVVLVLAAVVCWRDLHLSGPGTALVLVVIVAAVIVWWRFATHTLLPRLTGRHGTWQTRSGRLKVTVTCKSCGNSAALTGDQVGACPSCGRELGNTS